MSIANNSLKYNYIEVILMFERIRNLREDKDMTQTQVAKYLNCSQRIYSNYERGEVDIPTGILIKLADLHNTSTDYLLNRTNIKEPYPKY